MNYCPDCGEKLNEDQDVCLNCGKNLTLIKKNVDTNESGTIIYGILGFIMPVLGLILYLALKNTKPKSSKAAGIGALSCLGASVVLLVVSLFLIVILFGLWWIG